MSVIDYRNDREFLLKFATEVLGYKDSKEVARILASKNLPLPFNVERYPDYVRGLTNREPCPICGGPTLLLESEYRFNYPNGGGVCWRSQGHNVSWWTAGFIKVTALPDHEWMKLQLFAAGGQCQHERLLVDCKICMTELGEQMVAAQKEVDSG